MTRARAHRPHWLAGLTLAGVIGCAGEAPDAPELLVRVTTDFAPGALSHLVVETLDVQGDRPVDARWLRVGDACPAHVDGLRLLGTFSVQRGDQALARLRLTALSRALDGKAAEVGRARVDAVFARGRVFLDLTVSQTCSGVACPDDETCDPALGACRAVQRVLQAPAEQGAAVPNEGCIAPLGEPPPEVITRLSPATAQCVSGDGRCDAPCAGVRDADCLRARGASCLATADCSDGALCVHGVCCDRPCSGGCERCDLPDRAGTCTALRYLEVRAPLGSPDFRAQCVAQHVEYVCATGRCAAHCSAGFADCNGALQDDGCETPLATPQHCTACGDACTYGYCGEQGCTWHHTTGLAISDSRPLSPGKLYASGYVPSSDDRAVRALGVLLHPGQPGSTVRLALYAGNAAGFPDQLLAQTPVLSRDDAVASAVPRPDGAILLEGRLLPPVTIDPARPYFVAVQVAQETRVFGGLDTAMPWFVAPTQDEAFPGYFPLTEVTEHDSIALTMYAVTTPQ